ncbi:enoyl-CoA hydratase-related protein [Mesorhizobium sp. A623]
MSTAENQATQLERLPGHVAVVTLNRPQAHNAVDEAMRSELGQLVAELEADGDIRAVVLAAAGGRSFCAGADLKVVAAGRADFLWSPEGGFAGITHAPRIKPWIVAIEGAALAGGLEIALSCDMIVASPSASFGLPEVTRGMIAAAGGVYRLPRCLPRAIAMEMIATGERLDAERAYQLGMVNRLVAPGDAVSAALELARAIGRNAPLAVYESLSVARIASEHPQQEMRAMTDAARRRIMETNDYREGPRAFIEKRPPNWTVT